MRKHEVIRQERFAGAGVFQFDIETGPFENLLVSWTNTDDALAAPTSIIFCPSSMRRQDGNVLNNFPTPAALVMPVAGATLYLSFGPHAIVQVPLPLQMTFGVIGAAGSNISIRVEGDLVENLLQSPFPPERARS